MKIELKNPCKECICLPTCIAKSNKWDNSSYVSRFAYLSSTCKLVSNLWEIPTNRRIMNEYWKQYDITKYQKNRYHEFCGRYHED